jgi:ABC-type Fe3+/spermidine/putrescine transport system ATPase subunit
LSGGEQQRVALARVLVIEPRILLLDEPLSALDRKLREEMKYWIKGLQEKLGITTIYVTHDQNEALTMSDRIAVMNQGVVEQVDTPEGIYDRPRTDFGAGFIGVSNLMPGRVTSANGTHAEVKLDAGVSVRVASDGLRPGQECKAVVRPEKLEIWTLDEPHDSTEPSVEGMIEASVYLGTATQMVVRLPGDTTLTVLVPNTDETVRQRLPGAGAKVRLGWLAQHMHLIPAARESAVTQPAPSADADETEITTPAQPA